MDCIQKALNIAIDAHRGQSDKAGIDYINHPVYLALQMKTSSEKIVALLHDVLEDSNKYTYENLIDEFGKDIAEEVFVLTHNKNDTYFEYINKIKEHGGVALKVKLADLKHNMDITRIKNPTLKDANRIEQRYEKAYQILTGV